MSDKQDDLVDIQFVKNSHSVIIQNIKVVFTTLVGENKQQKIFVCQEALRSIDQLMMFLIGFEQPQWLMDCQRWLKWYLDNCYVEDANSILLDNLLPLREPLLNHRWELVKAEQMDEFYWLYHLRRTLE